ncbi:MAG TPA: hypothetical protein VFV05_07690 [Methylomirabilota bacterium]|nr:hypothetical protein [Methylomirabilota bacterium]
MGCTERRALVLGSIVFLLALAAAEGAESPAALDPPSPSPVSPAAFAERAAGGGRGRDSAAVKGEASFRNALELIVLAATCGIAVACYSALVSGRGGKRLLMRGRRR